MAKSRAKTPRCVRSRHDNFNHLTEQILIAAFASETAPFIAECMEDEDEDVQNEASELKKAVEAEAGVINGL